MAESVVARLRWLVLVAVVTGVGLPHLVDRRVVPGRLGQVEPLFVRTLYAVGHRLGQAIGFRPDQLGAQQPRRRMLRAVASVGVGADEAEGEAPRQAHERLVGDVGDALARVIGRTTPTLVVLVADGAAERRAAETVVVLTVAPGVLVAQVDEGRARRLEDAV